MKRMFLDQDMNKIEESYKDFLENPQEDIVTEEERAVNTSIILYKYDFKEESLWITILEQLGIKDADTLTLKITGAIVDNDYESGEVAVTDVDDVIIQDFVQAIKNGIGWISVNDISRQFKAYSGFENISDDQLDIVADTLADAGLTRAADYEGDE